MIAETKIYSDFIKKNKVIVKRDSFIYNGITVSLTKDFDGKWYAEQTDKCYTKKAAIYYYIKYNINEKSN